MNVIITLNATFNVNFVNIIATLLLIIDVHVLFSDDPTVCSSSPETSPVLTASYNSSNLRR